MEAPVSPRQRCVLLPLFLLLLAELCVAAEERQIEVAVRVPALAAENSSVSLQCSYNLFREPLYAVKWYRGTAEFYRYVPKELPPKATFPPLGLRVDLSNSDEHQVTVRNLGAEHAGTYRCEVSTDAPHFYTKIDEGLLRVARLPQGGVAVRTEKQRYAPGDIVRGNCSVPPGDPPASVTWIVNNERPVNASFVRHLATTTQEGGADGRMQGTLAGVRLEARSSSFRRGRLLLTCLADVGQLYREQATAVLDEERPKLASVLGTRESSHSSGGRVCDLPSPWLFAFLLLASASAAASKSSPR